MPLLPTFHDYPNGTSVKMTAAMDSSLEGKSKSKPLHLIFEVLGDCACKLPPVLTTMMLEHAPSHQIERLSLRSCRCWPHSHPLKGRSFMAK